MIFRIDDKFIPHSMKKITLKLVTSLFVFLMSACFANSVYSQSKLDCDNANTQAEINACAQSKYVAADKELNVLYRKIVAKLDAPQRLVLVQSQRKWISFRDEYCKIYGLLYAGGSMALSAVLSCKTESTLKRIAELRVLLEEVDR